MKYIKLSIAFDLSVLLTMGLLVGCETDSATQRIEIHPSTAVLRYGQSVTLTAYNGYEYTWSLQNESWGTLSSRQGIMVTYKSIYDPVSPAVQVVTVASTFSDNAPGSSNPVAHTAEAYITHIPATSDITSVSSSP